MIRKSGGSFSGYGEGWALYAEQLADEMGMYDDDPLGRIGYLRFQLFRALRCVADTGLHHLGWSYEQAIALFTALVFTMNRLFGDQEDFLIWFYGLIICLHFFFVIVLNFINLINSGENFDYGRIGYVIYGSLGLLAFWAACWPIYSIFRKFLSKEVV